LGSYILKAYYQYEALNVYRFDHQYGKLKLSDWMKFQKSFPCETNNFVDKMCAYKKVSVTELLYHRGQNDVLLIQLFEGETLKLLFQQYQVFVIGTVSPLPYNKH
jgi:hypothetical protein